ncbi:protein stoned-A [Condylostylus longicornis]|uniref:protein stoned-A n=1 Tax=Condylostylus longicornis TaxID=2530218 RepID=UPI00244DF20C|nr:protein stoned-A [Condylostylus longicornis]XP_055390254.1 protein stoned-A [Condylostylus longicornis]XP_055390255.1 protein stoned-A [Condylostylus longicornis]XP_055390256.1 protein stoned-A [Condylostylus longicornis]XP_055390257.1 protein stoned-A [Condylostylus longicornis]XP_055390258.1 protein stoned-A [Condylostylus longicornis]XP_055390259.1 protein stoned-A [Condylostylus longicornis]XP_055390260.1 protein stoned-A [Condylostylus longicornis]XP_055390261.1 protein stoned-A [Co
MLKLPKGLKKKKKKSKKDQELFTEEELEQYKREQKLKQQQLEQGQPNQDNSSETGATAATSDTEQKTVEEQSTTAGAAAAPVQEKKTGEEDEEWSKFKALTAGVDTILHKTQDELDRIKSTSFYQRVPTEVEKKRLEEEEAKAREAQRLEEERKKKEEEEANRDKLAEAVVELSESEEESEEVDDIFETGYIDAITSGEVQLAVVPDLPEFEDLGPDPFDTSYADTVIVGPQVSKTGKKLVALGSAVEVLTGRVDSAQAVALSGAKKKPRRGITNLLLESEEEVANLPEELSVTPEPPKTLLDDFEDEIPDIPIDLSVSLHLIPANKKQEESEEVAKEDSPKEETNKLPDDILSEFDVLKKDEDDEFAELAAESLTKKEEIKVITQPQPIQFASTLEGDWAEFELTEEEKAQHKAKPPRPPRPPTGPSGAGDIPSGVEELSDDEFNVPEDDPFDTAFVEQVIVNKEEEDDDFDFDPRAGEEAAEVIKVTKEDLFANLSGKKPSDSLVPAVRKDLLGGSNTDLAQTPIAPAQESIDVEDEDFDPFDTSAVVKLVQPKETELKILEKDLLSDSKLKNSLSDPEFDPRAEEIKEEIKPQVVVPPADFDPARRKSSLTLNIQSKSVGFLVPSNDLLAVNSEGGKIQKPLTPYYAPPEAIAEKELEDPFDTSFVPSTVPTDIELKHLEKDLLTSSKLKHSLSDPDFDPRADDIKEQPKPASDLLAVEENLNIKVLTPKLEDKTFFGTETDSGDPFDTSIASNIQPGRTELKLLEDELLPPTTPEITTGVLDTLTDAQELGLGDKVLTPQLTTPPSDGIEEIDPFDTSFAVNLGPGQVEIKLIESELIEKKY